MARGRQLQRSTSSKRSVTRSRSSTFSNPFLPLMQQAADIIMRDRSNSPPTGPFGYPLKYPKRSMSTPSRIVLDKKVKVKRGKVYRLRAKYHTTGRLGPTFKKSRSRTQLKTKDVQGATAKIECGGVYEADTSDTAYVGHAPARVQILNSISRVIYKQLFNRKRIPIKNWGSTPTFDVTPSFYWIGITYQNLQNNGSNQILHYVNPAVTWDTNIQVLTTQIVNDLPSLPVKFVKISLFQGTSATVSTKVEGSDVVINADDLHLHFEIYSKLNLQNRTLGQAVSGATNDPDADVETNIVNNPLRGKVYTSDKKWMNGFIINNQELGDVPQRFVADINFGFIHTNSNVVGLPNLKKPPPPWIFGVSKAAPCVLAPGQIKSSTITFKTSMKINTFLLKYSQQVSENFATVNPLSAMPFGFAEMIGLEKMLDARDETAIPISLSWELNQTYVCYGTVKADYRSLPITDISTTPL